MLTPQQLSLLKTNTTSTGAPGVSPTQEMTPEQAQTWIGGSSTPGTSYASQVAKNLGDTFTSGAKNVMSDVANIPATAEAAGGGSAHPNSPVNTLAVASGAGHVVGDIAGTAGGILGSFLMPLLPETVKSKVGDATKFIADKVNSIPGMTPEIAKSLGDVFNTVTLKGGAEAEVPAVAGAKNAVTATKEVLTPAPKIVETPVAAAARTAEETKASQLKAHEIIDKEVRNIAEKYGDVGKSLNASEVSKGTEPIKVLSSYAGGKALPTMSKGGKMNALPAINFLKTQTAKFGKMKSDLVKTAKQFTPAEDFKQAVFDRIDKSGGSVAKRAADKADAQKIVDELSSHYPKGIPTDEMDKIKSEQATASDSYRKTGVASKFSPDAHAVVGQTAGDAVITQGGNAPIDEMNKLLASHYDAIKLLEKMHGKTPHGGLLSKYMARVGGEVVGLGAGMAVGHPFIGAMAGRAGADMVEGVLQSHMISNPLKRTIITNMKDADPAVVKQALDYLEKDEGYTRNKPQQSQARGKPPK